MNVNAAHQQFNKIALWWKAIQNPVSQIQKKQQQKNAKLFSIKAVWEDIYCKTQKLQKSVVLQKISLNMNVNENNCQPKVKKFNSKTVTAIFTSESVRTFISVCVIKQAAVVNQITKKIVN